MYCTTKPLPTIWNILKSICKIIEVNKKNRKNLRKFYKKYKQFTFHVWQFCHIIDKQMPYIIQYDE